MNKLALIAAAFGVLAGSVRPDDTFSPYAEGTVPDNVVDLWKDVDVSKEPLEAEIFKEWIEEGVVCRL